LYLTTSQQLTVSVATSVGAAVGSLFGGGMAGGAIGGALAGAIATKLMPCATWQDVANNSLTGALSGVTGSGIANLLKGTMMHSMKAAAITGAVTGGVDALLMRGDPIFK